MAKSGTAERFWRCARCQTPNPTAAYLTDCIGCGAPRAIVDQPARTSSTVPSERRWPQGRGVLIATWGFVAVLLLGLTLMRWWGDLWWPGTLLLYMPRGLWLFPLLALALWNIRPRLWSLWAVHAALGVVILGPLMAFHVPWGRLLGDDPEGGTRLRVMTLNRLDDELNDERLIALIEHEGIDLICFQEGKRDRESQNPKLGAYFAKGWHWDRSGFIVSRLPIVAEGSRLDPPYPEPGFWGVRLAWVDLKTDSGAVFRLADVHMPTMATGFQWLFQGDFARLDRYQFWRRQQVSEILEHVVGGSRLPTLLAGDFNTPAESPLLDPLRLIFRFGHEEAGLGYGYTRPAVFPWIQIDQILATSEWTFTRCWVGPDVNSDHLPLVAEVVLNPAPAEQDRPR